MGRLRTYSACFLLILFSCYYSSINFFSHAHLVNGFSLVHSHLGGQGGHSHTAAQFGAIALLSNFQSEGASDIFHVEAPVALLSESHICCDEHVHLYHLWTSPSLRGPPQC